MRGCRPGGLNIPPTFRCSPAGSPGSRPTPCRNSRSAAWSRWGSPRSLKIFALPFDHLTRDLVASRAINWGNDPFARGAYSYATPQTRRAQSILKEPDGGRVFFSGEALYAGPDMGTVEAALASGRETAQMILAASA